MCFSSVANCRRRLCHLFARPTRWVWAGALILTLVLAGVAPYRAVVLPRTQTIQPTFPPIGFDMKQKATPMTNGLSGSWQSVRREVTTPIQKTITIPEHHIPASIVFYLAITWGTLSTLVLLTFFTVYLRFRRMRRSWPTSELQGVCVRIAPDGGPVVIGVLHPEIVIPQWLLGRSAEEQRVVLTHEQEHIRAGDPWLLAVACIVAASLPWHPLVWWMVSRLRLAIELDCDTRVLKRGIPPQTYGSLLIDLAGQCSGLPVRALALADNRSHLKRRLLAMKSFRPRFAVMQGVVLGSSAVFLLVTASVAQVPPRTQRMMDSEVAGNNTSEKLPAIYRTQVVKPRQGGMTPRDSAITFFEIPGNSWSVNASFAGPAAPLVKWIDCFRSPRRDGSGAHLSYPLSWGAARNAAEPNKVRDSVLVLFDGVRQGLFPINERVPFDQLKLNPADIFAATAYKGGHWAVVLDGPEAANGVIDIHTWYRVEESVSGYTALMPLLRSSDSVGQWSHRIAYYPSLKPVRWTDLFWTIERPRLRDSILLVVDDSTRLGMRPIDESIPLQALKQIFIEPNDISSFLVTSGPWAIKIYGANAGHGVVNIITKNYQSRKQMSHQARQAELLNHHLQCPDAINPVVCAEANWISKMAVHWRGDTVVIDSATTATLMAAGSDSLTMDNWKYTRYYSRMDSFLFLMSHINGDVPLLINPGAPLFIVDGKVKTGNFVYNADRENITGESPAGGAGYAVKDYGQGAVNGLFRIRTKGSPEDPNDPVHMTSKITN